MAIKFLISAFIQRFAYLFHQIVVEIEIMKHGKAHTEHFIRLEDDECSFSNSVCMQDTDNSGQWEAGRADISDC